jgi:hypothetical protein
MEMAIGNDGAIGVWMNGSVRRGEKMVFGGGADEKYRSAKKQSTTRDPRQQQVAFC